MADGKFRQISTELLYTYYTFSFWIPYLQTATLANSEDPDEMLHNATFNQGLHCLLRLKQSSGTKILWKLQPVTVSTLDSLLFNLPKV